MTRTINLRQPDIVQRSNRYLSSGQPIRGVFKGVFTKINGKWSLLVGSIELGGDSAVAGPVQSLEYPEYLFITGIFNRTDIATIISDLEMEGKLPLDEAPLLDVAEHGLNWTETLIPSHAAEGGKPIRRFRADVNRNVYCPDTKLVAHGMKFHFSSFEYIKSFLGLNKFHGSLDGLRGGIFIDVTDHRGRLNFSTTGVSYVKYTAENMCLVGSVDGVDVNKENEKDEFLYGQESVSDIELWLVDKSDSVVDYCSSSEWEFRYGNVNESDEKEKFLKIISRGESEFCEFKEYIELTESKSKKVCEIEKAVCALSNHEGGRLFIGVSDDAEVLGINDGCFRSYKRELKEAIDVYKRDVSKRLQDTLKNNQCFSVSIFEIAGLFIVVVNVQKVDGLNYLRLRNEVYVRRGASSAKMTPPEIQRASSGREILGGNQEWLYPL
nr:ATP-binding protein [Alcanivorax sp. VBW004]